MDYSKVINQVIVLFLILLVGFYCRKKNIINETVKKGLSDLLLKVTLPFMIISSFNLSFSKDMLINGGKVLLYSFIIHFSFVFISKIFYFKYEESQKNVLRFSTIFSNVGFMGYPILESIFGKIGIFYGAIFNVGFNLLLWTAGVMIFTKEKKFSNIKKVVINPALIAVFIGIIMFISPIKPPYAILKTLDSIGSMTTPLSMIIIGAMLAEANYKETFSSLNIYYCSLIRLLIMPICAYGILKVLGAEGQLLKICVIIEGMPVAVLSGIIAEQYKGDSILASRCIFMSTLLSIITIPLVALFIL